MKIKILMLLLLLGANAKSQESFEISSTDVPEVCDSKALKKLYVQQMRAAQAYCGTGSYSSLIGVPTVRASGNENCQRVWAEYSSASGSARYQCVHSTSQCESNCEAYGLEFSYCHSACGG